MPRRSLTKPTVQSGLWQIGVIAMVGAAGSAVVLPGLGYDAWAWMIWARELSHLSLDTTTGSTIKPLPMLLMVPFARFGDAAPVLWLTIARASYLLLPVLAWRVVAHLGASRLGRALAAAFVLITPVLFDAAVMGYSEPLTALLILASIWVFQLGRHRDSLVLMGLAGLMRPELWPFICVIAAWCARKRYVGRYSALGIAVAPILVWGIISWLGSGVPFGGVTARESIRSGSGLLLTLAKSVSPIVFIGCVLAMFQTSRSANRGVAFLLGCCAAWFGLFAVLTLTGFSDNARYLVPLSVTSALVAAWGIDTTVARITNRQGRHAAIGFCVLALIGFAAFSFHTFRNSVATFRTYSRAADGMVAAINVAGGRDQAIAVGRPIVMNWSRQTALAWQLNVPITGTQTIWRSDWTGSTSVPAVLIVAPPRTGGARASFPIRLRLRPIGKSGDWRVFRATAHAPRR